MLILLLFVATNPQMNTSEFCGAPAQQPGAQQNLPYKNRRRAQAGTCARNFHLAFTVTMTITAD
jgi:hypothetical protein